MTDQELNEGVRADLDEALLALDELVLENPEEALSMFDTLPEPVQAMPEFQLTLARAHQMLGQLEAARDLALGVVAKSASGMETSLIADAHHLLGDLLEDLGDGDAANEHFLKVLELDQLAFRNECTMPEPELRERLAKILETTIQGLPAEIRSRVTAATRSISLFPSAADVKNGLDPRAMTRWYAEEDAPGSFVLYGGNVDAEFGDLTEFDEFSPHVRAIIHEQIVDRLELSAADSKRFGLTPAESDE